MQEAIQSKLTKIEQQEQVKILFAIEAGSRVWGFSSKDSDYDVRFVYIRSPEWYLSITKQRDVLEYPIDGLLDINGWDIRKALGLLQKYNPALMEWLDSTIVYRENYEIRERLKEIRWTYFARKTSIHHYLSMAQANYRQYLKGDTVKIKKYFYVLRPLLACMWLEHQNSHPPLSFETLLAAELKNEPLLHKHISELLQRKISGVELNLEQRIDVLNLFIEERLQHLQSFVQGLPADTICGTEKLNQVFIDLLKEVWGAQFSYTS